MAFKYKVQQGDTLNSIAQKHGFSNYKEAGISSVPSGNFDLVRPNEEITLGNYDPNQVKTIQTSSPVISSKDNQQTFTTDSLKLDTSLNGLGASTGITKTDGAPKDTTKPPAEKTSVPFATGEKNAEGIKETTGDPVRDSLNKWQLEQDAKFSAESAVRKEQYTQLFTTSLSAIDATANATINNINASYDKRTNEQKRINSINIDRVKAYGLSNGGQYTPIAFSDAITNREQEAADKISELDSQRNSLIAQAKAARDSGASKLLREKLTDLDKIDTELRTQLKNVETEANNQYKLLRDIRVEEEKKHQDAVAKMKTQLSSIAPKYADQYDKMKPEEKDAFVKKIMEQTGLDYATIYGTLEGAVTTATTKVLDTKKKEADIKSVEALTLDRQASAAKTWADTAVVGEKKKLEATMQKEVPASFVDDAEFNAKREEFTKKYGVDGAKYWDAVFNKDSVGDYKYTKGAPVAPTASKAGKTGTLGDGRKFIVAPDGETLLDPKTKKPL